MRDNQRSKVYAAEGALHPGRVLPTMADLNTYVMRVTSSAWFTARYPKYAARSACPTGIQVMDGRARRTACGSPAGWIKMPRFARKELWVLHEIAHVVSPTGVRHCWQFTANYLKLVQHFMGAHDAQELKAAFKARRVRYTPPRKNTGGTPDNYKHLLAWKARQTDGQKNNQTTGAEEVRPQEPGANGIDGQPT